MFNQTCKASQLAFLVFTLLLCAATKAQAQDASEIRCRGGEDAFVIDKLDADTLSLNFNSGPHAAGADSKGLDRYERRAA
jgi:hypothetical protein